MTRWFTLLDIPPAGIRHSYRSRKTSARGRPLRRSPRRSNRTSTARLRGRYPSTGSAGSRRLHRSHRCRRSMDSYTANRFPLCIRAKSDCRSNHDSARNRSHPRSRRRAATCLSREGADSRHSLRQGFAGRDLRESVHQIKSGRGHQDMVLDLLALAIMGDENRERIERVPLFDAAATTIKA